MPHAIRKHFYGIQMETRSFFRAVTLSDCSTLCTCLRANSLTFPSPRSASICFEHNLRKETLWHESLQRKTQDIEQMANSNQSRTFLSINSNMLPEVFSIKSNEYRERMGMPHITCACIAIIDFIWTSFLMYKVAIFVLLLLLIFSPFAKQRISCNIRSPR